MPPATYKTARAAIEKHTVELGRNPDELTWTIRIEVDQDGKPAVEDIDDTASFSDQLIEAANAYRGEGIEHVVMALSFGEVNRLTEIMQAIATKVLPALR